MVFVSRRSKSMVQRWFRVGLGMVLMLLLGGCVQYDLGIQWQHAHHGAIVQEIHLGEKFAQLSPQEAQTWLRSIAQRAKQLQGQVRSRGKDTLWVTIPFGNGAQLAEKFNRFFAAETGDRGDLVQLQAHLDRQQENWIFLEHQHLTLDVDLRVLGVVSDQGNVLLGPGSLLDLSFHLQTPLGGKVNASPAPAQRDPQGWTWTLTPGQVNHFEGDLWLPNALGLGIAAIVALMVLGYGIKYRRLPLLPDRPMVK
jgi:hypothetical protein